MVCVSDRMIKDWFPRSLILPERLKCNYDLGSPLRWNKLVLPLGQPGIAARDAGGLLFNKWECGRQRENHTLWEDHRLHQKYVGENRAASYRA
jgi:hypothetical protein